MVDFSNVSPQVHCCPSRHYSLGVPCTLGPGHRDNWHQATHPDTGVLIRFRQALGARVTQELVDTEDGSKGTWTTMHAVHPYADPTPTVPDNLDRLTTTLLGSHHSCGIDPKTRYERCACGTLTVLGGHRAHVGREASLLARGYYDVGHEAGMREAAAMLRAYCPDHGTAETSFMSCHCPAADEIERDAKSDRYTVTTATTES